MDPSTGKIDCLGSAACVFGELGWSKACLEPGSLDGPSRSIVGDAWEHIGEESCKAKELGDLILSYGAGGKPHVSTLIDNALGLAFSAFEGPGAMVVPLGQIQRVRGIYRLKEGYR